MKMSLSQFLTNDDFVSHPGKFVIPLGTRPDDTLASVDIADIPHMIVSGSTGSGKTYFVHSMLITLMRNCSPEECQFVIFDSKGVDYSAFEDLPHMAHPIIRTWKQCVDTLNQYANIVSTRNSLNEQHIFIILDDFSELALNEDSAFSLLRILQLGRVAKIHCVLVCSAISPKTFPVSFKTNVPCRVSFYVPSRSLSKAVLELPGAEQLSYPCEFYFKWNSQLERCFSVDISDSEMFDSINYIRDHYQNCGADVNTTPSPTPVSQKDEYDELFPAAVDVIFDTGIASVSMIQRRLKLGYARAARLVDMMEEHGIIGPFEGSKPRKILMSRGDWHSIRSEHNDGNDASMVMRTEISQTASSEEQIESSRIASSTTDHLSDFSSVDSNEVTTAFPLLNLTPVLGLNAAIKVKNGVLSVRYYSAYHGQAITFDINLSRISCIMYNRPNLFHNGQIAIVLPEDFDWGSRESQKLAQSIMKRNSLEIEFSRSTDSEMLEFITRVSDVANIRIC